MNAVLLARVSSREQADGMSIDAQTENLQNYCAKKSLNVIKTYQLVESSTKAERKKFEDILRYIRSQSCTIALVTDTIDRMQRSFKESVELDELRKANKIEIHFVRENLILNRDSNSSEVARWDMGVFMAKTYVGQLQDNIKRSITFNTQRGIWQSKAPIGYLNTRDNNDKPTIIIDPERGYKISKLFEWYSTGLYSLSELAKKSKTIGLTSLQNGIPLSKTSLQLILKNPFYYGVMVVKGQKIPHIYPHLIDKNLFDKCQKVMNSKNNGRQKYAEEMFAFRGLITCSQCGNTISSDKKTKNTGKTYTYLRCVHHKNGCTQEQVNEEILLQQVKREIFDKLVLPKSLLADVIKLLKNSVDAESRFSEMTLESLHSQLENNQSKRHKLLDLLLETRITQDEYDRKLEEIKEAEYNINIQIKAHKQADGSFMETVESLLILTSKAGELFESSNNEQKHALLKLVCSNYVLDNKKIRFSLEKPFDLLVNLSDRKTWLGQLDSNQH